MISIAGPLVVPIFGTLSRIRDICYYLSRKCPDFKVSFNILRVLPYELIGTVFYVTEIVKNLYVGLQYGVHIDYT